LPDRARDLAGDVVDIRETPGLDLKRMREGGHFHHLIKRDFP
jgi:hypothetical protein